MIVLALVWAMAFRSGVGVMLRTLLVVQLLARIPSEERLLDANFGAQYEACCACT
jgi:protein-S-isoprenylcysteine O-methyltransferase Ste14